MNRFLKQAGLGVAMVATTVAAAAPADAQRWRGGYRDYHRGGGGRLATGALIGGIVGLGVGAAIASNNRGRYYDRGYYYDAPPRVVYQDRYYAPPPPPPRVIVRERYYEQPGYYGGYGGGYYDRGGYYGGW